LYNVNLLENRLKRFTENFQKLKLNLTLFYIVLSVGLLVFQKISQVEAKVQQVHL